MRSIAAVAFLTYAATRAELTHAVGTYLHSQAILRAEATDDLLTGQIKTLQAFALNKLIQDGVARANRAYTGDPAAVLAALDRLGQEWRSARFSGSLVQDRMGGALVTRARRARSSGARPQRPTWHWPPNFRPKRKKLFSVNYRRMKSGSMRTRTIAMARSRSEPTMLL
jgi:hypothetical protein